MKAFIEYPEASDDRIEVKNEFHVVSIGIYTEQIVEKWEKLNLATK
jgi:hypothetical protein